MSLLDAFLLEPAPFEVWFAYRTDGVKGSGTQSDPYNGITQALFDGFMANLPSTGPVRVHLGPTPPNLAFKTAGFGMASDGVTFSSAWSPRPGMTIEGAGMDATQLQLVPGTTAGYHYFAIGAPTTSPVDFLEVANLTINCDQPAVPVVACGAIRVMGNHVRVRNVKCINWGSRTTAQPGFVVALLIGDPDPNSTMISADGAVIEDCVAISPSTNNQVANAVVNVLHIGGRDRSTGDAMTQYGRAAVIRNCFVDCDSPAPAAPIAAEYRALSMGACKGGVVEGNQIHNVKIGGPYQERQSTADIIVRNNTYRNVVLGGYWKLGGVIATYSPSGISRVGTVLTVTVANTTGLLPGDRVKLIAAPAEFSGVYVVKAVQSTQFTAETPLISAPTVATSVAKLYGAGRIVFEGNHIELAPGLSGLAGALIDDSQTLGTVVAPDYVTGELYLRNNKVRYVDGAAPVGTADLALMVSGVRRLIVAQNVVDSANGTPVQDQRCGAVTYSNNRSPSGKLVRGLKIGGSKYDELETEAEDALVLAMLNER